MNKQHPSVTELAKRYANSIGVKPHYIDAFYFCDNKKDANECAELVVLGEKRATATSLWWFEVNNESLPSVGDCYIVTNWNGVARCVIKVEKVEITPFNEVTSQFAEIEGEGDKSLKYWRNVHWDYYHRELAGSGLTPSVDMPIVCEYFSIVFR